MAKVVIPEIKHEYIRQVDTETTKDSWFDECIADNKEAAWAGIGTSENDSQYQPAPSVEPDYYMQYCSSDDYDYLKDYRLIWGYGIGIIEQDVICSLSTGEHLAEGKDACDTYAAENAAGENTDWKRGTWIKFSGNRNVSPTRIGEVILPERVISLKDLCVALNLDSITECDFYLPIETNDSILNITNLCGQKSQIKVLKNSQGASECFQGALQCGYAFAYANTSTSIQIGWLYAVDCNHMFYHSTINYMSNFSDNESCNYTSMFEEATGDSWELSPYYIDKAMFKNAHGISVNTSSVIYCKQDVSECFYGNSIYYNINGIDFSEARNVQNMFYDINLINIDEIDLDLNTVVEYDDDIEDKFSNFFSTNSQNKTINIVAPNCKLKGLSVFTFYNSNINVTNTLYYYDYNDAKIADTSFDYNDQRQYRPCFILKNCKSINGNFNGSSLFYINTTIERCNITVSSKILNKDELINLFSIVRGNAGFMPCIFYISNGETNINTILSGLNIDNFYFPNNIFYGINNDYDDTDFIINKNNKEYCITNNSNVCNCTIKSNNAIIHYCPLYKRRNYLTEFEHSVNIECDNEINIDCIIVNYNITNTTLISYNIPNGNLVFNKYDDTVENYRVELNILFNNINTIDFNNLNVIESSYSNKYIIIKANKINNVKKNNGTFTDEYGHNSKEIVLVIKTDNNFNYIFNNNDYIPSLVVRSYNEDKLINYPIFENTGYTKSYLIGQFNNTPLSDYIIRNIDIELTPYTYGNTIEQIVDDIESEEVIIDRTINDLLNLHKFVLYGNFNHNFKIINNDYMPYMGGIDNKYLYCNKFDVNVINYESHKPKCYYYYMDYINSNINDDSVYSRINIRLYNCDNCTNCNIEYNNNVRDFEIDDLSNNIQNLSLNFVIMRICNLSYLDKLTQESINSIVNPSNYQSGATLTIHTTPFQYITEEQKQALVDAGVTLVEYIPTETTE